MIINEEIIDGDCASGAQIVRTWTAIDNCGNETTASQTIFIIDNDAPVFTTFPENVTVDCDNGTIPELPDIWGVDACDGEVDLIFNEETTDGGCSSGGQIIRTWTAIDRCGNTAMAVQRICLLYTSPSPRDRTRSRMPSSA